MADPNVPKNEPPKGDSDPTDGKPKAERSENADGKPGGPGKTPPKPPSFMSRGALGWILLGGLVVVLLLMMNSTQRGMKEISQTQFLQHARNGDFKTDKPIIFDEDSMSGTLKDPAVAADEAGNPGNPRVYATVSPTSKNLVRLQLEEASGDVVIDLKEEVSNSLFWPFVLSWGPIILIAILIYFFVFRAMRSGGGGPGMLGNFGRSRHKVLNKEHSSVTLGDVAGIDEAKDEVGEIIEFLKNPKKFQRLGGRVPRGVLMVGPPGCGKTLLAKAVAGEADVPFFSISGSDFVEMFVGVGASRVRDLFKQAKDSAPCIIFLDEIDAVGRRRGSGFSSGGHDEREQTLNAILVEMDGFDSSDQVIVIASTNRADVLDPALTRPGRFDRQVHVPMPDIKGRMEILKVHSRKVKLSPEVDLEKISRGTPMFSGAELEAVINEAAIMATLSNKDFIEHVDMEEARDKVRYGRSRRSAKVEQDERKVIAYHEAGHAVIMYYDDDTEPLHKVTIIPRGMSLGSTMMLPEQDRHIMSKKRLLAMMRVAYGGRIAEEMFTGDQYNGTAGDIRQANSIARAMVTEYGMSEKIGFRLFADDEQRNPWDQPDRVSEDTLRAIDEEIKRLIDTTYAEATALITDKRQQTEDLAQALLKYETLTAEEVDLIMRGQSLQKATVSELLQAERDKAAAAKPAPQPEDTRASDLDQAGPGMMPSPA
ncbi:MAG: ATP-dependent zinc metalloprotease FtsH [Planctomycetota bacterium]